jgi:hypothetical protein
VLANAADVLDDASARAVAREVLSWAGDGPWAGPAPRAWRTRVEEAVVKADAQAAERRRAAAIAARRVRSWKEGDGDAALVVHAGEADIALADQVITDLARAWPAVDPDGVRLSMDQRRADALIGLFRRPGSCAASASPPCSRQAARGPWPAASSTTAPACRCWSSTPPAPSSGW